MGCCGHACWQSESTIIDWQDVEGDLPTETVIEETQKHTLYVGLHRNASRIPSNISTLYSHRPRSIHQGTQQPEQRNGKSTGVIVLIIAWLLNWFAIIDDCCGQLLQVNSGWWCGRFVWTSDAKHFQSFSHNMPIIRSEQKILACVQVVLGNFCCWEPPELCVSRSCVWGDEPWSRELLENNICFHIFYIKK